MSTSEEPNENNTSKIKLKEDLNYLPSDIESYVFYFPIKLTTDHLYLKNRKNYPSNTLGEDVSLTVDAILNEKVFNELTAKYPIITPSVTSKKTAPSLMKTENAKELRELLKRIMRYNNSRKYEERIGFATTLADKADEIGVGLTIKYILPIIEKYLVLL